jgi:hypothetical protein
MLPTVFVVGDSISVQYHPFLERALCGFAILKRKSGMEEAMKDLNVAVGANGGDSSNCLAYLGSMVKSGEFSPHLLLLNCGLHDVKCKTNGRTTQVAADQYERNLTDIVNLIAGARIPLAWMRTTQVNEAKHNRPDSGIWRWSADVDRYNAISDAVMTTGRVPIVDLAGFTQALGQELTTDGRHFPEAIQAQQAAFLSGWIRAYFHCRSDRHARK